MVCQEVKYNINKNIILQLELTITSLLNKYLFITKSE